MAFPLSKVPSAAIEFIFWLLVRAIVTAPPPVALRITVEPADPDGNV